MYCLECGEEIGNGMDICPFCGFNHMEFMSDGSGARRKKKRTSYFAEEECLVYGIHPDDEMYRKTIELNVLSKK